MQNNNVNLDTFVGSPIDKIKESIEAAKENGQIVNQKNHPIRYQEWSIEKTLNALKKPIPPDLLGKLRDKGNAPYVPWYVANVILNKYCPGWEWEIIAVHTSDSRITMIGKLTLHCKDGSVSRCASGSEVLKEMRKNKANEWKIEEMELAYGDPSSNAESMCFRRACARFGLALYLYNLPDKKNMAMYVGKENLAILKEYGYA